ncbi:MAG TPA: hypothetical protein VLY24_01050 [Bryobacteraceae bacterium]|nr:hypothetical protein [Bryobacteraceae bacterium]
MKKMIRVAALALLAVSLLSSKSTVKVQPASLAQAHPRPDAPAPGCYPCCLL